MKSILSGVIILLLMISGFTLFAQSRNDLLRVNLKGRVKSDITLIYSPGTNEKLLKNRNLTGKQYLRFDENGNITELGVYDRNGNLNLKNMYTYDGQGRRIAGMQYIVYNVLKYTFTFFYDEAGNRNLEYCYDLKDSLRSKSIYRYNEKGLPTEILVYGSTDSLTNRHSFAYDDNGNIIESARYDAKGDLRIKYHYLYEEHDKAGNWLKQTTHIINRGLVQISVRKIEYYKDRILTAGLFFTR